MNQLAEKLALKYQRPEALLPIYFNWHMGMTK